MAAGGIFLKAAFVGVAAAGSMAIYGDFTGQSGAEVAMGLWNMTPMGS